MIAIVLLFFLGMLLPFVLIYGLLAWFLVLPLLMGWAWIKPHLVKLNIPRVVWLRIAAISSLLTWAVLMVSAN